ncbi:MAG: AmmeMemoRadiSam system radical SAM enzyme [Clostridiales bacterium]|nr:AmmeMemoRadiSam system radical SAM enzyme [Clostridiales bacterium]MBR5417405.1 AmmeMemoRadiSam system radical SAM enzyme [Clostridiales bacterium]
MTRCHVCFRHCELKEGQVGFCGARIGLADKVVASNYGKITSLALDPIEKKPLNRFFPGTKILSVGSYGCNLRCPFCQNSEISWGKEVMEFSESADTITPEILVRIAEKYRPEGNIGIAFTYNEPLIGYEFIRDTAKLSHEIGLKNVLVTNGTAELSVLEEIAPYVDAMNIDLKGFTEHYYNDLLDGCFEMTKSFIEEAVKICHVELTTLIIPRENDSPDEMRELSSWVSELKDSNGSVIGKDVPLHISRFFPRFHMTDRSATPVKDVYALAEIAREKLNFVYTGNC